MSSNHWSMKYLGDLGFNIPTSLNHFRKLMNPWNWVCPNPSLKEALIMIKDRDSGECRTFIFSGVGIASSGIGRVSVQIPDWSDFDTKQSLGFADFQAFSRMWNLNIGPWNPNQGIIISSIDIVSNKWWEGNGISLSDVTSFNNLPIISWDLSWFLGGLKMLSNNNSCSTGSASGVPAQPSTKNSFISQNNAAQVCTTVEDFYHYSEMPSNQAKYINQLPGNYPSQNSQIFNPTFPSYTPINFERNNSFDHPFGLNSSSSMDVGSSFRLPSHSLTHDLWMSNLNSFSNNGFNRLGGMKLSNTFSSNRSQGYSPYFDGLEYRRQSGNLLGSNIKLDFDWGSVKNSQIFNPTFPSYTPINFERNNLFANNIGLGSSSSWNYGSNYQHLFPNLTSTIGMLSLNPFSKIDFNKFSGSGNFYGGYSGAPRIGGFMH